MTKYLQDNDMQIIIKQTLPDLYQYKLDIIDKYKKFVSSKLKNSKEYFKSQFYFYVGLLKKFYESQILINKFEKIRLKQMVIDSLQFCLQVTQTKKISIKDCSKYKYPLQYYELMQENFQLKLSFTMTPSRILVANAIIFCMAVKLPIVIEGKAINQLQQLNLILMIFDYLDKAYIYIYILSSIYSQVLHLSVQIYYYGVNVILFERYILVYKDEILQSGLDTLAIGRSFRNILSIQRIPLIIYISQLVTFCFLDPIFNFHHSLLLFLLFCLTTINLSSVLLFSIVSYGLFSIQLSLKYISSAKLYLLRSKNLTRDPNCFLEYVLWSVKYNIPD